jgi:flagellin-like hook-associated protein FlgL
MIRVTTNGVLNTYRSNLNTSATNLNQSRNTVLTQRNFNSYGEDPAAATQAFQLRRAWHRTSAQYTVSQSTIRKFNTAWQALSSVEEALDTKASNSSLSAVLAGANDPTAAGRNALGVELDQLADNIVQTMNTKYGDNFIFSGADGETVPFTWQTNADGTSSLLYRGHDVSAAATVSTNATATLTVDIATYTDPAALGAAQVDGVPLSQLFDAVDDNGNAVDWTDATAFAANAQITLTAKTAGPMEGNQWADLNALTGVTVAADAADGTTEANPEYENLTAMAGEKNFVDIGLGLQEDGNGNLIESSAFNDALQGINYLGYGVDEDGDSKNIACIVKEMGRLLKNCDDNGNWASDEDASNYSRLLDKFQAASAELKSNYVQMDAKATFLNQNDTQLKNTADTLNEQFLEIEQCDLADAITSFSWAQYCYNAALKVGNSILSQSLIDYMS